MTTREKDPHGPGKEKRGTSSSPYLPRTHTTTPCRRSPSAPSPSCLSVRKHGPSTTPSEKRIPNYLKPTVSSASNPSFQGSAQRPSNDPVHKATLNRRRSFDKPTSPHSYFPKSHTLVNPTEKTISLLSSNVVSKTNLALPNSHKERFLKAHRDVGKSHSVFSSNKKTTAIKNQTIDATICVAAVSNKARNSTLPDLTADATLVVQCHLEDRESSVADVEQVREMNVDESNDNFPCQVSVLEAHQKEDIRADTGGSCQVTADELEKNLNQEMYTYESSSVLGNPNKCLDAHMEEAVDEEEIVEETRKYEIDESRKEEIVVDDDNDDNEEGEESATENSKEKYPDKKKEVDEGNQRECKDGEGVKVIETETKKQMDNMAGKQHWQGKRETQASNDVIEETACKLLEKRKNKVKALVGAFETVMSLQEPED